MFYFSISKGNFNGFIIIVANVKRLRSRRHKHFLDENLHPVHILTIAHLLRWCDRRTQQKTILSSASMTDPLSYHSWTSSSTSHHTRASACYEGPSGWGPAIHLQQRSTGSIISTILPIQWLGIAHEMFNLPNRKPHVTLCRIHLTTHREVWKRNLEHPS